MFVDDRWYPLPMPRRMMGRLSDGPSWPSVWRTPRQSLRGRIGVEQPGGRRFYVVSIHSRGNSVHWIARFVVNGTDVPAIKNRTLNSSIFRNEEWLFDVTGPLREGENLFALAVDGTTQEFDVDVFEPPCVDREWYNDDK